MSEGAHLEIGLLDVPVELAHREASVAQVRTQTDLLGEEDRLGQVGIELALLERLDLVGQAVLEELQSAHLTTQEQVVLELLGALGLLLGKLVHVGHAVPLRVVQARRGHQVGGDELQVGLERRPLRLAHAEAELTQLLARVRWHVVVHVEYVLGVVERVADALDELHVVLLAHLLDGVVAFAPHHLGVLLEREHLDVPVLEELLENGVRLAVEAHEVNAVRGELRLEVLERLEQEAEAVVAAHGEAGREAVEDEDGHEALALVGARQQRRIVVQAQAVTEPVNTCLRHVFLFTLLFFLLFFSSHFSSSFSLEGRSMKSREKK